jgi:hypothetical protein
MQLNPVLILTGRELFGQFIFGDFLTIYEADAQLVRGLSCARTFGSYANSRKGYISECRQVMTYGRRKGESKLRKSRRKRRTYHRCRGDKS